MAVGKLRKFMNLVKKGGVNLAKGVWWLTKNAAKGAWWLTKNSAPVAFKAGTALLSNPLTAGALMKGAYDVGTKGFIPTMIDYGTKGKQMWNVLRGKKPTTKWNKFMSSSSSSSSNSAQYQTVNNNLVNGFTGGNGKQYIPVVSGLIPYDGPIISPENAEILTPAQKLTGAIDMLKQSLNGKGRDSSSGTQAEKKNDIDKLQAINDGANNALNAISNVVDSVSKKPIGLTTSLKRFLPKWKIHEKPKNQYEEAENKGYSFAQSMMDTAQLLTSGIANDLVTGDYAKAARKLGTIALVDYAGAKVPKIMNKNIIDTFKREGQGDKVDFQPHTLKEFIRQEANKIVGPDIGRPPLNNTRNLALPESTNPSILKGNWWEKLRSNGTKRKNNIPPITATIEKINRYLPYIPAAHAEKQPPPVPQWVLDDEDTPNPSFNH